MQIQLKTTDTAFMWATLSCLIMFIWWFNIHPLKWNLMIWTFWTKIKLGYRLCFPTCLFSAQVNLTKVKCQVCRMSKNKAFLLLLLPWHQNSWWEFQSLDSVGLFSMQHVRNKTLGVCWKIIPDGVGYCVGCHEFDYFSLTGHPVVFYSSDTTPNQNVYLFIDLFYWLTD